MYIFVGNLSPQTRDIDIREFFKSYSKEPDISLHKSRYEDTTRYFAKVVIEPERKALKAINKLAAKKLNGRPVQVREYHYRAGNNDRRALNWRSLAWQGHERRLNERRFKAKSIQSHEPNFTGYANLAMKGG